MTEPVIIETNHLVLKAHTSRNFQLIKRWIRDTEIMYLHDLPLCCLKSERQVQQCMRWLISSSPEMNFEIIHFGIHKISNDALIGFCMIDGINREDQRCSVGLTIGEKNEWGKGYGFEVVNGLSSYCFDTLQMNRVGAEILAHNTRSIRLFERCGFQREGIIRQWALKKNQFVDKLIYGILKAEWILLQNTNQKLTIAAPQVHT